MSQGKIKLYKNQERNMTYNHKPYVPQYQILGVEPEEFKSSTVPDGTLVATSNIGNPRLKGSVGRQPYAETPKSKIGVGKNVLPNVGNNMDQTWSSLDGSIIDDFDSSTDQYIDNNDYVAETSLGISERNEQPNSGAARFESHENDDLLSALKDLEDYLLIVSGVAFCSGPLKEIEEQARLLVFGDHEYCDGNPVSLEDIIIVKKVSVKMGLFLE